MRKKLLSGLCLLASVSSIASVYCDDCWQYMGRTTVNWTFTGGSDDCYSSYHSGNMYSWATAYVYEDGVLVDIIRTNSSEVRCDNYV